MIDWTPFYVAMGCKSEAEMWTRLYITEKSSIESLSRKFNVSPASIMKALRRAGIKVRGRGGANRRKIDVTDALIDDVQKRGVPTVARELRCDASTLYKKIFYQRGIRKRDLQQPQGQTRSEVEPTETKGESSHDEHR